jgi:hypothetical protein
MRWVSLYGSNRKAECGDEDDERENVQAPYRYTESSSKLIPELLAAVVSAD